MNKKKQLQELVRHIIRTTLKELSVNGASSFRSMSDQDQTSMMNSDPNALPVDAMTPFEKAKQEREDRKRRDDAVKSSEEELKTAKKESDFQKQKVDQTKRFEIPALQKRIQTLKGGV